MRLSKTAWTILGIGIIVIVVASLGSIYLQQNQAQQSLRESLVAAQAPLPQLTVQKEALEEDLAEVESDLAQVAEELEAANALFPTAVESIDVGDELYEIASEYDLDIMVFTSSEPADNQEEEGVTLFVTTFTVQAEGTIDDILSYISAIAMSEPFEMATIEVVNIKIPEPTEEDEDEDEEKLPSATIDLTFYGYRGE